MTSEEVRREQKREADRRMKRKEKGLPPWKCPECGQLKYSQDTWTAHRYIAHGVLPEDAP